MASTPGYAATPKIGTASIATGDTSRTGPSSVGTVWTAGSNGGRIDVVHIVACGTTTQGVIRLFVHDGSVYRLLPEIEVTPKVATGTGISWSTSVTFDGGLALQSGYSLRATTHNSETFHVIAQGADL